MSPRAIAAIGIAFGLSVFAVALLAHVAARLPQDAPNQRSLHIRSVPRAGGYAIWAGFVPIAFWYPPSFPGGFNGWFWPWLLLASISAADDARGVVVGMRLCAHVAAAIWAGVWLWLHMQRAAIADPLDAAVLVAAMALLIAWSSNLYNFMDGSDGLCATMTLVGLPPEDIPLNAFPLIRYRRSVAGSLIGGIPETQEMLDFCGKHGFACDIEMIRMDQINEAYERMLKSDVKYRFVIDMATLT